ncbi:uncharacterized protein LOC142559558 [Dermacentor variabilis]|uniref:uncharacterized protein LOC142559558 n=1 Tax=Dermacentor variabilis TaxID=34621 RepID=UPI003F5AFE91
MAAASASEDGRGGVQDRFIDRVMSVPSVNFLCFATAEYYSALKKRSALAAIALDTAEKCASHAYSLLGKPVVEQLSGPLRVADDFACEVLQTLENNYPVASKMPHEIVADARDFGKRKYTDGRDYVQQKIDYLQGLSGPVLDAACRPVDTATSVVRCTRAIFWHHVTIAEWACDAYIKTMDEDGAQETDPRDSALPRLLHASLEASVYVSRYAAAQHQRAKDFVARTFAAATRFLAEPAEPLRQPTTAGEHASAALRHVVKASVQLVQVYVDKFALIYRTVWCWLSARFTRQVIITSERTSSKVSTLVYINPACVGEADDSQESSTSYTDSDSDDSS